MANQPSLEGEKRVRWRTTLAPWAQEVAERSQELRDQLEHVEEAHRERLAELLSAADLLAYEKVPIWRWASRISDWWYGSRVERAWSYIHEAELLFVEYADARGLEIALDNALGYAATLSKDDPVRLRFEAYVQSLATPSPNGDKTVDLSTSSIATSPDVPVPEPTA
jgi:hypothetical protein